MKKSLLAIALTAMVSLTASAVTVQWTSDALNYGGTVLKSNSNVSAYLLYLSEGTLATYTVDDSFAVGNIGTVVASTDGTVKSGKIQGKFEFDFEGTYGNGDSFGLLVSYANPEDGNVYYNLSSVVNTLSGITMPNSVPTFNEFTMSTAITDVSLLTGNGGWTPAAIPEPATGALALAGLALLFRRKRA